MNSSHDRLNMSLRNASLLFKIGQKLKKSAYIRSKREKKIE